MFDKKFFGTDGIRGKANLYPMVPEIAMALGRAVVHYFESKENKHPLVIIGKDTRLSCYMMEQAFSAGALSQGGRVIFTGPLPTPGVAFVTKNMRANVGIMISASHNSYEDNGIKIFGPDGFKLDDSVELELENLILHKNKMPNKTGKDIGRAKRLEGVEGRYIVHVKNSFNIHDDLQKLKIVVDCSNGAAYKVAPMIFSELGAEVIPMGVTPNGENINLNCGSLYPEQATLKVIKSKADIGFCLDGDADRLQVIDREGRTLDGDKLIGIFSKLMLHRGILKEGDEIVGTIMSNIGLEIYLRKLGLKFHRTKVGDRYIMEYMRSHNILLGGEPSGHIIFSDHTTTGDGTLAALKVIEAVKILKTSLEDLSTEVELFPQVLKSLVVRKKRPLEKIKSLQKLIKKLEEELGKKGRIVIRYSGTEPLVRVMVEGQDYPIVNNICNELMSSLEKELGDLKDVRSENEADTWN